MRRICEGQIRYVRIFVLAIAITKKQRLQFGEGHRE